MKKIKFVRLVYHGLMILTFRILLFLSDEMASKFFYKRRLGKNLNLRNPQTFNEKLQWLKIYWRKPLISRCADKYEMRSYVEECGFAEFLNELHGVYEDVSQINWDALPNRFAIKTTNACGTNIICTNKSTLDIEESIRKLKKWMRLDYSLIAGEIHYRNMKPRIIVERYLETDAGLFPNDYKLYCFNGKAKLVLVATNRGSNLRLNFLDLNWNRLDIGSKEYNLGEVPDKPECFSEMVKAAESMAAPFPFVRVDFYEFNGKPLVGEFTFTPAACAATYYSEKGDLWLGAQLALPGYS